MNAIEILREIAAEHSVTLSELRSRKRLNGLTAIRRIAAKRLRTERKLSLNQIGLLLGGRNHSCIYRMIDDAYRERHMARLALISKRVQRSN